MELTSPKPIARLSGKMTSTSLSWADILEVFSRKLKQHLAKPLAFHTTLSGTDPLRTKRLYQRLKTAQLKAHLEDSEPLKAVMQLRTVYSLST